MAQYSNPFLEGTLEARRANEASDAAQQQGLARLLQMQQMQRQAAQDEQAMPLKMDLLRAQVEDAQARPGDRLDARNQTKELTLARIGEQARRSDMEYDLRIRAATDKNEAAQWTRARDQARLAANEAALRMTGERLFYDIGKRVDVPSLTVPGMSPGAPSAPTPATAAPAGLEALLRNRPPAEQAAIQAVAGAGNAPMSVTVPAPQPAARGPVTAPVMPPQGGLETLLPAGAPITPASMSMAQSGGTEGRFPQVGPAAGPTASPAMPPAPVAAPVAAAPAAPQMPQFVGSPRERAAAANRWTLDQAKTGGGSPGTGDYSKTGDAFLETIPPADRAFVKKLANYDIDPKTLSTRGGERERALKMAAQYDPTFDQKNYASTAAAINRFATGQQGNTVRSLNVAIEHIDSLQRAADALKNGNFTPGNRAYNEISTLFGATPPNTFEAMRDIVANEVVKGTIGNAGALADRAEAASRVRAQSSPEQLAKLFDGWRELMGGQVKGLEKQYEGATRRTDFQERYLTPRAREAIERSMAVSAPQQRRATDNPAPINSKGWKLMTDKNNNRAYVGPGGEIEEVR